MLRQIVPDWQAVGVTINNHIINSQNLFILDLSTDFFFQQIKIDRRIEFPHVHLQNVKRDQIKIELPNEAGDALHAVVRAASSYSAVRVADPSTQKDLTGRLLDRVLNNAVFYYGVPVNYSFLAGIPGRETTVFIARLVRFRDYFFTDFLQFCFRIFFEVDQIGVIFIFFRLVKFFESKPHIPHIGKISKNVSSSFHVRFSFRVFVV